MFATYSSTPNPVVSLNRILYRYVPLVASRLTRSRRVPFPLRPVSPGVHPPLTSPYVCLRRLLPVFQPGRQARAGCVGEGVQGHHQEEGEGWRVHGVRHQESPQVSAQGEEEKGAVSRGDTYVVKKQNTKKEPSENEFTAVAKQHNSSITWTIQWANNTGMHRNKWPCLSLPVASLQHTLFAVQYRFRNDFLLLATMAHTGIVL